MLNIIKRCIELSFFLSFLTMPIISGCTPVAIVMPYVARVETVTPDITGLVIQATSGGGGELEIINNTDLEVVLINESGDVYVRLTPTSVYELIEGKWTKTKDTPIYYCHDPRIAYIGPEPDSRSSMVVKDWYITGKAGDEVFTITGNTLYIPHKGSTILSLLMKGIFLLSMGILLVIALIIMFRKKSVK